MQLLETLLPEAEGHRVRSPVVLVWTAWNGWCAGNRSASARCSGSTPTHGVLAREAADRSARMVGFSFQATKDAFYGQYARATCLLLTYESLARNPSAAMRAVYQFIGEPWFEHDSTTFPTTRTSSTRGSACPACILCARRWSRSSAPHFAARNFGAS